LRAQLFENIATGSYTIPPALEARPLLVSLLRGLLEADQEQRLSVQAALAHPWLAADDYTADEGAWRQPERDAVIAISALSGQGQQTSSSAVLRSIARKYGEELVEDSGSAAGARLVGEGDTISAAVGGLTLGSSGGLGGSSSELGGGGANVCIDSIRIYMYNIYLYIYISVSI